MGIHEPRTDVDLSKLPHLPTHQRLVHGHWVGREYVKWICVQGIFHITYGGENAPIYGPSIDFTKCTCHDYPLTIPDHLWRRADKEEHELAHGQRMCRKLSWLWDEIPKEELLTDHQSRTPFSYCIGGVAHFRYYRRGDVNVLRNTYVNGRFTGQQEILDDQETEVSHVAISPCRCRTDFPDLIEPELAREILRRAQSQRKT